MIKSSSLTQFLGIIPEIDFSITIHNLINPYTIIKSKSNEKSTTFDSS